jgi:hypothetical protein
MQSGTARVHRVHVTEVAVCLIVTRKEGRIITERNSNAEAAGNAFPPAQPDPFIKTADREIDDRARARSTGERNATPGIHALSMRNEGSPLEVISVRH